LTFVCGNLKLTSKELETILYTPKVNRRRIEMALSFFHTEVDNVMYSPSNLFYTYISLKDGVTDFAVHHSHDCSVFTVDLTMILMGANHTEFETRSDSMSLINNWSSGKSHLKLIIHLFMNVNKSVEKWHEMALQWTLSGNKSMFFF
jgi:hypothetical protein